MQPSTWTGCLLAVLLQSAPAHPQQLIREPEQAQALVSEAISSARVKQSRLPPPANDSERLLRMADLEQAPRLVLSDLDLSLLDEATKRSMWVGIWSEISAIDRENQALLLQMVPRDGWFPISRYGRDAAKAAFLIVQHSDSALWRRFLPTIESMVRAGEAEGEAYALMYDRLALNEGRPQRFGSQLSCVGGKFALSQPVEDIDQVDARRLSLGLVSSAENLRRFTGRGC
jgi:hypothetical protein